LTVPAASYSHDNDTNGSSWGGGYEFFNGTSYNSPTNNWSFVGGLWQQPTLTTSSSNCSDLDQGCQWAIWSGITNLYQDQIYIAQAGTGNEINPGGTVYWLWYEYAGHDIGPNNCGDINAGDDVTADAWTNAYTQVSGNNDEYQMSAMDDTNSTVSICATSSWLTWSSGLDGNNKYATLMGEVPAGFGSLSDLSSSISTPITGDLYDQVYGSSAISIYTPYNNAEWVAWHADGATESAVRSNGQFTIHYPD